MIGKCIRVCFGNIGILLRRLFGTNIKYSIKSLVSPFATLRTSNKGIIVIDSKVEVRSNTEITARHARINIGKSCFVNRNCMIVAHEKISIGEYTTIGPNTCIYDHDHDGKGGFISGPISIGKNVWIGAGCIILKGVTIGDNVVVGAGTIVLEDIESNCTVFDKREKRVYVKREGV